MCGWWSDGYRCRVVGHQGEVKGQGGHRESPVHLDLRGRHTGKTLEEGERERERQKRMLESESGQWREIPDWVNKSNPF